MNRYESGGVKLRKTHALDNGGPTNFGQQAVDDMLYDPPESLRYATPEPPYEPYEGACA